MHELSTHRLVNPLGVWAGDVTDNSIVEWQIKTPILFLAGQLDEMVPPAHMHQLFEAAQEHSVAQHTFVEFPDGMHMDTWMQGGERYWRSIEVFMQNHAAGSAASCQGYSDADDQR